MAVKFSLIKPSFGHGRGLALLVSAGLAVSACSSQAEAPVGGAALAGWSGPATITDAAVALPLAPAAPAVLRGARGKPLAVEIADLRADQPSGTTYNVFVGRPRNPAPAETGDPDYVGTFSLFDIAGRGVAAGKTLALDAGARGRVGRLLADAGAVVVTITPRGGDKTPLTVGGVRLVAHD